MVLINKNRIGNKTNVPWDKQKDRRTYCIELYSLHYAKPYTKRK